jgi:hypothetical protein
MAFFERQTDEREPSGHGALQRALMHDVADGGVQLSRGSGVETAEMFSVFDRGAREPGERRMRVPAPSGDLKTPTPAVGDLGGPAECLVPEDPIGERQRVLMQNGGDGATSSGRAGDFFDCPACGVLKTPVGAELHRARRDVRDSGAKHVQHTDGGRIGSERVRQAIVEAVRGFALMPDVADLAVVAGFEI